MRDAQAEHARVIAAMQRQLDMMSAQEVDSDKTLAKMITQELNRVKRATQQKFKSSVKSDPRKAYQAIRAQKYKKVWGGNINILDGRSKRLYTTTSISNRQRTVKRHYSSTSKKVDEYYGQSRGFILRFLQTGTKQRTANGIGGSGNRGSIKARDFMSTARTEMDRSRQMIGERYLLIVKKQKETYDGKG